MTGFTSSMTWQPPVPAGPPPAPRMTPGQASYSGYAKAHHAPGSLYPAVQETGNPSRQVLMTEGYAASTITARPGQDPDPREVQDAMSRNPGAAREGDTAPGLVGRGRTALQGKEHGPDYQDPQNWYKNHEEWFTRRELEDKIVVVKGYDWDKTTEELVASFQEYGEIEWVKWFVEMEIDAPEEAEVRCHRWDGQRG